MKAFRLFLGCLVCMIVSCWGNPSVTDETGSVPEYYVEYLDSKAQEIEKLKSTEADGFFFWTDSHYPENGGNAAAVINYLQKKTGACFVFNGGDVAKNADDLKTGLDCNTPAFELAASHGLFFPVRGNHDYTSSTSRDVAEPETMDDRQVYEYLAAFRSKSAIMNADSPYSNYYYVDSQKGRVRYIILDTTDSVKDSRVVYGMSDSQLAWVFDNAVASLPEGWSVVFLSHVPLTPEHTSNKSINEAALRVSETARSRNVLFCLSGHRHSDIETGVGSTFQILTESDCLKDTGRTRTPYSAADKKKETGTTNEQTIDYVSISQDYKVVTMKRIGHGFDRVFNVCPITVKAESIVQLRSSRKGPVKWFAYDAEGSKVGQYGADGYRDLQTRHQYVEISDTGLVRGLIAGTSSIAVATYEDGTKEYYMIRTTN